MAYHESCKTTIEDDKFNCPHFAINQETLARVVEANTIKSLHQYGGINGIAFALQTNLDTGILGDPEDLYRRHEAFGSNHLNLEEKLTCVSSKWLYRLCLDAFKDTTIILLLCCGLLSLVIGIKKNGPKEGFLDGAILFLSMFIVVNVGAICRYFKGRMIKKLSRNNKKMVGVLRRGKIQDMPVSEVVVGDIVILKQGDQIPADGLFLQGDSVFMLDDVLESNNYYKCPSLFTGSKVMRGECRMLVTLVGRNTEIRKLMKSISFDDEQSLLQTHDIDNVNSHLEKIWLVLSLVLLAVQVVRCFVWESLCDENEDHPDPKGVKNTVEEIMNETTKIMKKQLGPKVNGLVTMLCILVFALRDGLPLGTFIYLSYASKRMMSSHRARIRRLQACVTIGSVTTICTGITGDLALQHMKMADLWVGHDKLSTGVVLVDHHHSLIDALREGVCMNACGAAQNALLCWAQNFLGVDIEELNQSCTIHDREAPDLNRTRISLTRKGDMEKVVHVHWKGAPQIVLSMCSHYYDFNGAMQTLDQQKRDEFNKIIDNIGCDSTIQHYFAFAYKKLVGEQKDEEEEEEEDDDDHDHNLLLLEDGLTLLAIVALKNPYVDEGVDIRESIEASRESGVKIKLVVNEDINIARFMAINSGIMRIEEEDTIGAIIEASKFRNSFEEDRMSMVDNLRVMFNASPADKLLLLQCLRHKEGEVVAITGTSTRDSPWLKQADVGILVGDGCEELVKTNSSDIVILDLKLVTVCEILEFGRSVRYYLNKLFQFHLILNNVAFSLNFIIVLCTSDQVPLTPFQILWVNLIMDVLIALTLASLVMDLPKTFNHRNMYIDIAIQSVYQVTVLLVLNMRGKDVLKVDETTLKLITFNCYLLGQVFQLISTAREIKKRWFLVMVVVAILVLQVGLIEIGAFVTHWERLDLKQWCICIGISAISLPIGWVAKFASFT